MYIPEPCDLFDLPESIPSSTYGIESVSYTLDATVLTLIRIRPFDSDELMYGLPEVRGGCYRYEGRPVRVLDDLPPDGYHQRLTLTVELGPIDLANRPAIA